MRNILFTATLIILSGAVCFGQRVIMEQDVNADTVISNFGKNKKSYFGSTFGIGVPVEQISGNQTMERGRSWTFHYGTYYKLRASNFYSVVAQANYQRVSHGFEVPSSDVFYQQLITNNISGALFNRFNFGKRGNFIGYYISLGASADYTVRNKLKTKTESLPDAESDFYKTANFNLNYINRINYNAECRIGINKLIIFGKYRVTDAIKQEKGYQLPPTTVGVMFDFGA